jgi:NAD(P)-dependent dehydrogenase (short-subunit alcohol dehydrogenase family)
LNSQTGKTLFITGASRGIGEAIALRAARDGANVVLAAKSERESQAAGHHPHAAPRPSRPPAARRCR